MKNLILTALILVLISCAKKGDERKIIRSNSKTIECHINGKKIYWNILPEVDLDVLSVEAKKEINEVLFKTDIDSIRFDVREKDSIYFDIVLNDKDTAATGIVVIPEKVYNSDPLKSTIHTEDIYNFWKVYHQAKDKSIEEQRKLYQKQYFDIASVGMKDYINIKIKKGVNYFVDHINKHPKFYDYIEKNTLQVDSFKPQIVESFKKLKEIYPASNFPDIYFGIGAFTSGGTISDNGLLIGTNQVCDTKDTPKDDFSFSELSLLSELKVVPHMVAHELIHFQQNNMSSDTITLGYAIKEGMADFVGELISGETANARLHQWAKGKEKMIWDKFKKDMYYSRYSNWLANSKDATKDNFADQGYWVGYQICKSYYNHVDDKKQAIYDMFNIKDYKVFLRKSLWEEDLSKL